MYSGLQKKLQNFASELGFKFGVRASGSFHFWGFKLGVMRGFQKGITLGGRTSGSVRKVYGVLGWAVDYRVTLSPY